MNIETTVWPLLAILFNLGSYPNVFVMCAGECTVVCRVVKSG